MKSRKQELAFNFLWPNLAVAVVMLVLIVARQVTSIREFLRVLVYALVYSNLVAIFGALVIGAIAKRFSIRKLPLLPVLAFCIIVVVPVGCLLVQTLLTALGLLVPQRFWQEYFFMMRYVLPLASIFGLGALTHASLRERLQAAEHRLYEKEVAEERSQKLAAEAQLRSLQSRIHPHFLFNTLNSISALIAVNPVRAEQIVGRLATLLRGSLDNSGQPLIPLHQELALVTSYLDIERARFEDRLHSSLHVPAELQGVKVPPMSVQSLVENAVKYGISPQSTGGEIAISASAENGNVRVEVRDTGPGFDLSTVPAGHGLDNLVCRLNAIFGEKARLNVIRRDGCSVVEMVLPRL